MLREVLLKTSEATCLDVDYNLIDQGAFLQSLTSTLHTKLKSIVKPRYKYTLQTFLVQNTENDRPPCYDDVIKEDYQKIAALKTIFPLFDFEIILKCLRAHKYNFAETFDALLKLKLI